MKRVLFVAEAVTLAQVVRLLTLARSLPPNEFDVHFAAAATTWPGTDPGPITAHRLRSLTPAQVERAVTCGTRIYSRQTLTRYLDDDLRLLDRVQPELVVGDLRWSLSSSAALRGIPSATLINAYWSPHAVRTTFPVPHHPAVQLLGERLAARHVPRAMPWALRYFARPLDAVRRAHRLPPLGDLLTLLTDGTLTLYPDAPELVPVRNLPETHHFLGPVLWQPEVPLPDWWNQLGGEPVVYLTLGSSGPTHLLPALVESLARLPVQVVVALAGRGRLGAMPRNVFATNFLPGDAAVERAAVVVSNGGSSTGYQALARGRPVIGVPWNLDQLLATQAIDAAGAGASVRGHRKAIAGVAERVEAALGGAYREGVERARNALIRLDSRARFLDLLRQRLDPRPSARS